MKTKVIYMIFTHSGPLMSFRFVSLFLFIQLFIQQSKWSHKRSHKCSVNTKTVQYLLLLSICTFPRTFRGPMSLRWLTSECCWHFKKAYGFSGQHGHGPTGKTEASVKKATEEWNLASHEQEYLTCSTAKKKKRRQVEIQLATFSAHRLYRLCTASCYRVLKDLLSIR